MIKKLGGIIIMFVGCMMFSLGLVRPIFDHVIDSKLYVHVILGIVIVMIGVILYKKDHT
jgi:predicted tellurium resistance membrane protein TerC